MRRNKREIIFVCSVIINNDLISKMIEAKSIEEASNSFEKEYKIKPKTILGPFYKKKKGFIEDKVELKLKFKFGENKQGIYDGWNITGIPLLNPANSIYILFNKRIDEEVVRRPKPIILRNEEISEKGIFK